MYTAINHFTGEFLVTENLKCLWDIIRRDRRVHVNVGEPQELWTLHRGDPNHHGKAFYRFPGVADPTLYK